MTVSPLITLLAELMTRPRSVPESSAPSSVIAPPPSMARPPVASLMAGNCEAGWMVPATANVIVSPPEVFFAAVSASRREITLSAPGSAIKWAMLAVFPSGSPSVRVFTATVFVPRGIIVTSASFEKVVPKMLVALHR